MLSLLAAAMVAGQSLSGLPAIVPHEIVLDVCNYSREASIGRNPEFKRLAFDGRSALYDLTAEEKRFVRAECLMLDRAAMRKANFSYLLAPSNHR